MCFLNRLFSAKSTLDKRYLVVDILGFKLKISRRKMLITPMQLMREVNSLRNELDELKKIVVPELIKKNHLLVLKRLQTEAQFRKINVVLLLNSNSCAKFSYDSLYHALKNNPKFDVKILVSCTTGFERNKFEQKHFKEYLKNNYLYFKNKGYDVDLAYDLEKDEFKDLINFNPDIVFYTEPWEIAPIHDIENVSKFALTCFCIYGTSMHNGSYEYEQPFYRNLFKYFMDNQDAYDLMIQHGVDPDGLKVVGSIKLDAYLLPINETKTYWTSKDKKRVIYAPHHSFHKDTILKYGTFDKNYTFFLDYAKKHQEIEFIFKPHPALKKEVVRHNLMSEQEINAYYQQWASLPNAQIIEDGNYYDMFRTSDLMITDCNSFLSEYLPTQKPLILLISENSVGYNVYGQKIIGGYYKSYTNDETEKLLDELLYKGNDPLSIKREDILNTVFCWNKQGVANEIINVLENLIFEGDKN